MNDAGWTFYFWTWRDYDTDTLETYGFFRWGHSVYNSRIEGFTYNEGLGALASVRLLLGVG